MSGKNVADFYPLSPLQQGILFQTLAAPGLGMYLIQLNYVIRGDLNTDAFVGAWNRVAERHAVLRTAFVGQSLKSPVQAVHRSVSVPLEIQDWRQFDEAGLQHRLEKFLAADSQQDFNLEQPPLMRLALIRLQDQVWRFVWTFHHLLLDRWSVPFVVRDAFKFYEAFSRGEDLELERPRPYRDYISWLYKQDPGAARAYWTELLRGVTAPTSFEVGLNRNGSLTRQQDYRLQRILLPEQATSDLRDLARRYRLTMNTLVQAAWALLLHRYSGSEDVVFGTVSSGRPAELPGVESMVGLFINALPVRVRLNGEQDLVPWMAQLQQNEALQRQYQYTPLAEIQKLSELPRATPLFESFLVFESTPIYDSGTTKWSLDVQGVGGTEGGTGFPLHVGASPGTQLSLSITYDACRFDDDTVQRMLRHFSRILEEFAENPARRISEIELLSDEERRLLSQWNRTDAPYRAEKCLLDLFQEQVEKSPEAIALISGLQRVSYRELNRRANRIARHLRTVGVRKGDRVGIFMGRSVETVAAILAALKCGAVYLSLDPESPKDRLRFMIEDADPAAIVTVAQFAASLGERRERALLLDELPPDNDDSDLRTPSSPLEAAYVIYTSGSTGTPKGVVGLHRSTVNRLEWMWQAYPFEDGEVCCHKTSLNFVDSVCEIFSPLLRGIPAVIISENESQDAEHLVQLLRENEVTRIVVVPSLLRALLDIDPDLQHSLPRLRFWVTSGETLPVDLWELFSAAMPDAALINLYGSSEVAADVTFYDTREFRAGSGAIPIGRPISNIQTFILDSCRRPAPIGVAGELYIGGAGLSGGYLNRAELTAERFVANPFSAGPDELLFKTGDRARYLPDGNIEYLGRFDQQVKIRGFRVELEEIESVLSQHAAVRDAAVALWQESPSHSALAAYVVVKPGMTMDAAEMRTFLKTRLPDYMVPALFSPLDQLPLTASGKTDRRRLPPPDRASTPKAPTPPRNRTEELLAGIWCDVLSIQQVGVHDNFFELGGDSIVSIRMIAKARKAGLRFTPKDVFEYQTIAELAAVGENNAPAPSSQPEAPIPLAPAQRRFLETCGERPEDFVHGVVMESRSAIDAALLESAAKELVRRHEPLRLRFRRQESGWSQFLQDEPRNTIVSERSSNASGAFEQLAAGFSLSQGPLLQIAILDRNPAQGSRIAIAVHPLVTDAASVGILARQLESIYRSLTLRLPVETPDPAPFRRWPERAQQELSVGRNDTPQGSGQPAFDGCITALLDSEHTRTLLEEVVPIHDVALEEIILSEFAHAAAAATGKRRLLLETAHDARRAFSDLDMTGIAGPLTIAASIVRDVDPAATAADAAKVFKGHYRNLPARSNIDADTVAKAGGALRFVWLGDWRTNSADNSLFRLVDWVERPLGHAALAGSLALSAYIGAEGLHLSFTFRTAQHGAADVKRLSQLLTSRLQALAVEGRDMMADILAEINLGGLDED